MTVVAESLDAGLVRLAASPRLLVAVDFDGTIAPIVERPWLVVPDAGAIDAMAALAALADTTVAVVSARALADLTRHLGPVPGVLLYGSYGAETHDGAVGLSEAEARRVAQLAVAFERLAIEHERAWVEPKSLGMAFHARGVPEADELLARAAYAASEVLDVHVVRGDMVVEAVVRPVSKAGAVDALARRVTADAIVYAGDDRADEEVFAALGAGDLGVHVGRGPTSASRTLPDPAAVGGLLARLAQLRAARTAPPPDRRAREDLHHAR